MDKLIDMHVHTNYSDGDFSPEEIIKLAKENNIGILGITDHDTLDGVKAINNKQFKDIKIVKGIEISAHVDKGTMHILGYDIDLENKELNDKLEELKTNRFNSTLSVMEQIRRDYGIKFSYKDIIELINSRHIGRPDLARLCIKYGYSDTISDAFNDFLNPAKDKTRKFDRNIFFPESISLIKNSGGIAILAHPKTLRLNNEELDKLIANMKLHNLDGIEVYNSIHKKEDVDFYLELAKKYDLLISGGTDYHGVINKPDIKIGTGKNNNIKIKKLSIVDELKRRNRI